MMCQELACALRIQSFRWGTALRFQRQVGRHPLDHRVMREELRDDLNVSWISFPMFRDHTREEGVGYEQYYRARRPARLPGRLDVGRGEIHGSRITPALDWPPGHFSADAMPPREV